jgi:diguanylate cyclase (GGDEF)-like protein
VTRSYEIAIVTSAFALKIASGAFLTLGRLAVSSLVMGAGISAMHYSGMAAIRVVPMITYERPLLVLSVLVAFGASFAALWLAFRLRSGKTWMLRLARVAAAVVMGLAIAGMHYIGMAASQFGPDAYCVGGVALDNTWIAVVIGVLSLGMVAIASITTIYDGRLETEKQLHTSTLERSNAQLQHQATHDALTGLPNRVLLLDRLDRCALNAKRQKSGFAVLAMDLDRFKNINDSLGHSAGDELLREVARRLGGAVRQQDTIARMGGDEFVIVLESADSKASVEQVIRRIVDAISLPYDVQTVIVHTTPSIGVCFYPGDGEDAGALLMHADEAMYFAKQQGRNNHQFFTPEMDVFSSQRLQLESDLRIAIKQQQFELHYQPKVDVQTGIIGSTEALIRWRHPLMGMIPPDRFIPMAEETGLILPIGEWALREACRQARAWQIAGMPITRMAVNLSALQFRQERLFDVVSSALNDAGLDARHLELELTETCVMSNSKESALILERLSRLGVLISIDDFGTGYSSMSYLRRFPIDKLKIDRSFIKDLGSSQEATSIVQAIISLAHSLKLKVIAEGVETPEQLAILKELGCDQYQGYHFSKPLPSRAVEELVQAAGASRQSHAGDKLLRTHSKLEAFRPA